MPFCATCGVDGDGLFCASCGTPREGRPATVRTLDAEIAMVKARMATQRHGFPAMVSFFIPGLGQMIKGQFGLGLAIMVAMAFFAFLCIYGIGVPLLCIAWIAQLYDAYVKPDAALNAEARRVNELAIATQARAALNTRSP